MSNRVLKMLAISISVFVSIAITTIVFGVLENGNDALKATCIAIICSSLALDIYPRLTFRFSKSKLESGTED